MKRMSVSINNAGRLWSRQIIADGASACLFQWAIAAASVSHYLLTAPGEALPVVIGKLARHKTLAKTGLMVRDAMKSRSRIIAGAFIALALIALAAVEHQAIAGGLSGLLGWMIDVQRSFNRDLAHHLRDASGQSRSG